MPLPWRWIVPDRRNLKISSNVDLMLLWDGVKLSKPVQIYYQLLSIQDGYRLLLPTVVLGKGPKHSPAKSFAGWLLYKGMRPSSQRDYQCFTSHISLVEMTVQSNMMFRTRTGVTSTVAHAHGWSSMCFAIQRSGAGNIVYKLFDILYQRTRDLRLQARQR